jgi:hypothetical protein
MLALIAALFILGLGRAFQPQISSGSYDRGEAPPEGRRPKAGTKRCSTGQPWQQTNEPG